MRRYSFWLKIASLLGSLFIGLLFSEAAAGWYIKKTALKEKLNYIEQKMEPQSQGGICGLDSELGWSFIPKAVQNEITSDFEVSYTINSYGLRDKEFSLAKPSGEFRILALGESNVFGQGINYGYRFTEIIENCFKNVEVINMGVWGFGIDQSYLELKRQGFQYSPDLVILFVIADFPERCKDYYFLFSFKPRFIVNKGVLQLQTLDFIKHEYQPTFQQTLMGTDLVNKNKEKNTEKYGIRLLKKSNLWFLITLTKKIKSAKNRLIRKDGLADEDKKAWGAIDKWCKMNKKERQKYNNGDFEELIFLLLRSYNELCVQHGVSFMVIYANLDKEHSFVEKACKKLTIPYLDLRDILVAASKQRPLLFKIDPHYNEFAHRVIGENVSSYLKDKYNLRAN